MPLAQRVILRVSWALLFAWFGIVQLANPTAWIARLPEWTGYIPMPAEMAVRLNGWLAVCLAILLGLGLFTRASAWLLAGYLLGLAILVPEALGARTLALVAVGVVIGMNGADAYTVDETYRLKKTAH